MIGDQVVWNCGIENTCEMCNTRLFLSFSLSLASASELCLAKTIAGMFVMLFLKYSKHLIFNIFFPSMRKH